MNVFLFPGQSSRRRGMFQWLRADHAVIFEEVAAAATAIVGGDWEPDPAAVDPFPTNRSVQLAVFVANHMHLQVLQSHDVVAAHSAGLSLGEYNHLVHIGALEFEDALRLVDARGRAYDAGPRGCMAAIFPLVHEELAPIVEAVAANHPVAISNYNSPQQHVVAGTADGVAEVVRRVEEETFAEARVIERDVPMHCERFRPASVALRSALDAAAFSRASLPYVPNVEPRLMMDAGKETFVDCLTRHVFEPVRFRETVDLFLSALDNPVFIEVGPRHVVTDLLHRRWCKRPKFSTHDQAALDEVLSQT